PARPPTARRAPGAPPPAAPRQPEVPPPVALAAGLMPLASTGVEQFLARHPTYDGRGVLLGVLDTGVDPGVDGLILTSTGAPKIVELRDFSGEGRVALTPVTPVGDSVAVGDRRLGGAGRIARLTSATTWYAGVLRELPLGKVPAADLNGDGNNTDVFPVVVVRASDGWVAFLDTNLNGSFEDEMPLHDYRQGRETIALGTKPITLAANFAEINGVPLLDFVFDNFAHGTHVAGIAAGHGLFNVAGFDGVAPGAQILGLKIANAARGGVSVTGSMQRALEYAATYAERRAMPLVLNLSFGVGNEFEGRAVMDSIVNAFLLAHPGVVLAISAGNDGPGLSTLGFPGAADLALSVGAAFPGAFARPAEPGTRPAPDVMGWWSSRGGDVAKPDLVTPGVAFSSVPPWDIGNEIKGGTSMAAPHAAGLAACLFSAMLQEGRRVSAADVVQALRTSATRFAGETVLDEGAGLPHLEAAYRWLLGEHQGSAYVVRASRGSGSAVFLREGLESPGDTLQLFHVRHVAGLRAAEFVLKSSARWLAVPATVEAGARETEIPVTYQRAAFAGPGVYSGTVTAWNANDSLAGPLFWLPSTVVVPADLSTKPFADERRAIGAGRVQRYFVRAAPSGATLEVTVTLPDSATQRATARLYEPTGQPFRDREEIALGLKDPGTGRFTVRAEDLVPGVYELDVFAPPLAGATATVGAALAPVALTTTTAGVELANPADTSVAGRASVTLLGAARTFAVTGRGAPAESLVVRVPEWAQRLAIDVAMPREQWNVFTDFGVTEFDSSGQQVAQGALNYAFGRHGFDVPADLKGRLVTVELFPAFARAGGARAWHATVRVRFLLKEPRSVGDGRDVTVVAGGRAAVPLERPPSLPLPSGAAPLLELRVRPLRAAGVEAIRQVVLEP
ncbi:MAG TPA: S8 family serine peptidase, partial [Gemmatimonadales bacterium]|nr:S8 family serine peptidase [Gemmatimonadales bacterium]